MTTPPPTPVPRITPKTTPAPRAAPATASASAKQFASFAMRTGRPSARARSSTNGRPFRQVEFELRWSPVTGEIEPGAPSPTGVSAGSPQSEARRATSCVTARIVPS